MPIKVIQTTTRVLLSLSACPCVCLHILDSFFLLTNTGFTIFHLLCKFFSAKPESQGLVTDLWFSHQDLVLFPTATTSTSAWPGTKALLQAAAGREQFEIKTWLAVVSSCYTWLCLSFLVAFEAVKWRNCSFYKQLLSLCYILNNMLVYKEKPLPGTQSWGGDT